jgi:hypothetical protein
MDKLVGRTSFLRGTDGPNNTAGASDITNGHDTFGYRANLTVSAGGPLGVSAVGAIQFDSSGNRELQFSLQWTYTPMWTASLTEGVSFTDRKFADQPVTVRDLRRFSSSAGFAGGFIGGGEMNVLMGNNYMGGDFGLGLSTPGAAPQFNWGYTVGIPLHDPPAHAPINTVVGIYRGSM